jgi:hypothetical protein
MIDNIYNSINYNKKIIVSQMNHFLSTVMITRGGRVGSGLGSVLESLWGYNTNVYIKPYGYEMAWFPEHQYNDFAVVSTIDEWNPSSRSGEFFRVEAKSMQAGEGVDEPKAHFTALLHEISNDDAILVISWEWYPVDEFRSYPKVTDFYFNRARPVAQLRDYLHTIRKGSFVNGYNCPDRCLLTPCHHHGEPLNSDGKRERKTGPNACRVSNTTSHAANFGGMIRMTKLASLEAKELAKNHFRENQAGLEYIQFIHRNYPKEEGRFFSKSDIELALMRSGARTISDLRKIYNYQQFLPYI